MSGEPVARAGAALEAPSAVDLALTELTTPQDVELGSAQGGAVPAAVTPVAVTSYGLMSSVSCPPVVICADAPPPYLAGLRSRTQPSQTLIVGGGPAGLASLIAAARSGSLPRLLAKGLTIVERGPRIGAGNLGDYGITSDSAAETFLSAVVGQSDPRLARIAEHPVAREIASYGRGAVPLAKVGLFLALVGDALHEIIEDAGGTILTGHEALSARRQSDGGWLVRIRRCVDGAEAELTARSLVLAAGGHQPVQRLASESVAGAALLPSYRDKLVQSDHVLRAGGLAEVQRRLGALDDPRVAVIGGSTSAVAAVHALLHRLPEVRFGRGAITLLHRRELRVFYPSVDAARAEGYDEFGADDVCPLSGFVFRLAGFRLDSRELVMQARGIGGRAPETRLGLHRLSEGTGEQTQQILERADMIVAALGYRPRGLPLFDLLGLPIKLHGHTPPRPMVDEQCRVLDEHGAVLPNVFGIGLAAGFVPRGKLGGERSFVGQANGLWLWQNAVGELIVEQLLEARSARSDVGELIADETSQVVCTSAIAGEAAQLVGAPRLAAIS